MDVLIYYQRTKRTHQGMNGSTSKIIWGSERKKSISVLWGEEKKECGIIWEIRKRLYTSFERNEEGVGKQGEK